MALGDSGIRSVLKALGHFNHLNTWVLGQSRHLGTRALQALERHLTHSGTWSLEALEAFYLAVSILLIPK